MGLLVDGKWQDQWYDTKRSNGKFERQSSQFRDCISADKNAKYQAESGRYHLYVSLACPWAHRALIFRKLKSLESHIDVSVVSPDMLEYGWTFADYPESTKDNLFDFDYLHQVYTKARSDITTRVTVPVLWDKQSNSIVNNESAEIIRMFNSEFNHLTGNTADFYPQHLREDIDKINEFTYHNINNGVYKAGFATTQQAYVEAVTALFSGLDRIEKLLSKQPYLIGDRITEADWRLFTTIIRFDAVYVGHFKCNLRRIDDYPHISNYLRELFQYPGVADTVNMDHIKRHYYFSHHMINPTQVVPHGPILDFMRPYNRSNLR